MYLLIDNYDSFSYNLYQLIGAFDPDVAVARNDALTLEDIAALSPRAIFSLPGRQAGGSGICPAAVRRFGGRYPYLWRLFRPAGHLFRPRRGACLMRGT